MAQVKLPKYSARKGWEGGEPSRLYVFIDKHTRQVFVRPGNSTAGIGPNVEVAAATRAQAEEHWQKPLASGWKVVG